MTKEIQNLLICALTLVIISAGGCAQERRTQEEPAPPEELSAAQKELEQAPEEMLSTFSVSGYAKGGKKQWDLEGTSADIMAEEIKLKDVTGKVYGKEVNMTLVADEGSLNRLNNSVHLEKNVQATTDDGATLITDYLDWDAQNQKLTSSAPVWIKRGMLEAKGTGMISQPVLNLVQLKKDVTVKIAMEKSAENINQGEISAPTVITCKGPLEVDYQNNLAIFYDNVIAKDSRGNIWADRMDVYFTTEAEKSKQIQGMEGVGIKKIVAIGNVEIHHAGNITYSEKAVYDTDTGKLILTGQPKLVIYSTEGFSQLMGIRQGHEEPAEKEGKR